VGCAASRVGDMGRGNDPKSAQAGAKYRQQAGVNCQQQQQTVQRARRTWDGMGYRIARLLACLLLLLLTARHCRCGGREARVVIGRLSRINHNSAR